MTILSRPRFASLLFIAIIISAISSSPIGRAIAQDAEKAILDITGVDVSAFPQVSFTVYGERLGTPLSDLQFDVLEDGVPQTITTNEKIDVGIQTALVIDSASNIRSPGLTNTPRFQEIAQEVVRFVFDLALLDARTDHLATFYVGSSEDDFATLTNWTSDHGSLANTLEKWEPRTGTTNTKLLGLLKFTLDQFADSGIESNKQRSIVVFSDGIDTVSEVEIADVAIKANALHVRIYPVLIGPNAGDGRVNMERLAILTDGEFLVLDSQGSLDRLWRVLASQRTQQKVTYRSANPDPRVVSIDTTLGNSRTINRSADFPPFTVRAAQVIVPLNIEGGVLIERVATEFDSPVDEMMPREQMLHVAIEWTDGYPRQVVRVDYTVGNEIYSQTEGISTTGASFPLPIQSLDVGEYTLRVEAVDELGLIGRSEAVRLRVEVARPPAPTPTPEPESTPEPEPTASPQTEVITVTTGGTNSSVSDVLFTVPIPGLEQPIDVTRTLLLTVATPILFLLILLVFRSTRRRKEPGQQSGSYVPYAAAVDPDATEPVDPFGLDDATEPAIVSAFGVLPPAYLLYEEGGDHLPKRIALEAGRETRIGRRASYSDVVLEDKRISRIHAVIQEREDGFFIRDEGSSGGTFVNKRHLGVSDNKRLNHNDTIHFNAIAYRFALTDKLPPEEQPSPTAQNTDEESTEVIVGPSN